GRFLDVGVGVASLSISMCRAWPELRVVGVDPYDVSLDIARGNVVRAGLSDRIELRQLRIEELRDETAFDLAWLPAFFIPEQALAAAITRVHAALRPDGWLLLPVAGGAGPERPLAVLALINELW